VFVRFISQARESLQSVLIFFSSEKGKKKEEEEEGKSIFLFLNLSYYMLVAIKFTLVSLDQTSRQCAGNGKKKKKRKEKREKKKKVIR
jgi:hypothetical protein